MINFLFDHKLMGRALDPAFRRGDDSALRRASQSVGLGCFVFDADTGQITACSPKHAEIFGLTPETFIARTGGPGGSTVMAHPSDRAVLCRAYAAVRRGETAQMEYRFRRPNGEEGYICETLVPEFDDAGHVVRALGSSLDVTQARGGSVQARHSERQETLNTLTAGVAHDFNNILAVIMGNAQLGQAHKPTALMNELLDEILVASQRGARLTKSLLSFAQRATMVPRDVMLNDQVSAAVETFEREHTGTLEIVTELTGDNPWLSVDTEQFQSVLLNLLTNAVEASPDHGKIHLRTAVRRRPGRPDAGPGREGDECTVSVKDEGWGIAPENLHRVTDPFFTTKSRAKGSGLGLSMALGFAQQSGGALAICAAPGGGTEVRLSFPLLSACDAAPVSPSMAEMPSRSVRVLLLEDDPAVSDVLKRQLELQSFTVVPTGSAEDLFAAVSSERFDIAIFDNIVPGSMNGVDIARDLRSRGESLPIILLTGLPTELSDQHLGYVDALLHKPVPLETLLRQIETSLARQA